MSPICVCLALVDFCVAEARVLENLVRTLCRLRCPGFVILLQSFSENEEEGRRMEMIGCGAGLLQKFISE